MLSQSKHILKSLFPLQLFIFPQSVMFSAQDLVLHRQHWRKFSSDVWQQVNMCSSDYLKSMCVQVLSWINSFDCKSFEAGLPFIKCVYNDLPEITNTTVKWLNK